MANKYLDSTGVKHLWDKIKTWTNSNFQPIGSSGSLPTDPTFNTLKIDNTANSAIIKLEHEVSVDRHDTKSLLSSSGLRFYYKEDPKYRAGLTYYETSDRISVGDKAASLSLYSSVRPKWWDGTTNRELATLDEDNALELKIEDDDDYRTLISPSNIINEFCNNNEVSMNAEECIFSIYFKNSGEYTNYGYGGISYKDDSGAYNINLPQKSGTFVVANKYGTINLTNQNNDNPNYMELSPNSLYFEEDYYDESGCGFSCTTYASGHRSSYYDDDKDVTVYMNAQNQEFGIEEYNYGQYTYYKNGEIGYFNTDGVGFNYYFPQKTGTLATLDDIQEGGTKIQILTWEDDD